MIARLVPTALALVAFFVSSTVVKNDRHCVYRDYRGREHVQTIPAANLCPASVEVPND
ncbi:MAG TPA: hypothetical protein VFS67_33720 [Polyangiaceae bacterium]|nr:hypothetical protein [Polyangiaceae bacterium]